MTLITLGDKVRQNQVERTVKFSSRNYRPIVLVSGKKSMSWNLFESAQRIIEEKLTRTRLSVNSFRKHLYGLCCLQKVPYYHPVSPNGRRYRLYSSHSSRKFGAMMQQLQGDPITAIAATGGWLTLESAAAYCDNVLANPSRVLGALQGKGLRIPPIPLLAENCK